MNSDQILSNLYYNNEATKFANASTIFRTAKQIDASIKYRQVTDFLKRQKLWQVSKPLSKRTKKPHYLSNRHFNVSAPHQVLALDTMYTKNLKCRFPFLICMSDLFSRRCYGVFVRVLSAANVFNAFLKMITTEKVTFRKVFTDMGGEFGSYFTQKMSEMHIEHYHTSGYNLSKTSIPERQIQEIRQRAKKLLRSGLTDGVAAIREAISIGNYSYSRAIGTSPMEADKPENSNSVLKHILRQRDLTDVTRLPKFHVNQLVRIALKRKNIFAKSGDQTFSTKKYLVSSILETEPLASYTLSDTETNSELPRTFGENDLINANFSEEVPAFPLIK